MPPRASRRAAGARGRGRPDAPDQADFVYEIGATIVSTPPPEVFEKRHGVCQDFAHVMIAGLRGLGLPAAYVSGYLRTMQPPDEERLAGADATHAWVLVWCGADSAGAGSIRPTTSSSRTTTWCSRSAATYADVAPIDGIIFAAGGQRLKVAVSVRPIAE